MLVSKSSIQQELGSRLAEFAPPGEQLFGLFEAEYGDTPFLNPTGTPIYVLLTTNYVLFLSVKKYSNKPKGTLGTVPRGRIRFGPPDNGIAHFWVMAQMQDEQGQAYQLRLKIHKMWREEATALTSMAGAPQPQPYPPMPPAYPPQPPVYPLPDPGPPQNPYPQQRGGYPQQGPYPPQGAGYPQAGGYPRQGP